MEKGRPREIYNIGGGAERRNLEVFQTICDLVDELAPPRLAARSYFLYPRPSLPDLRYAIDASKIERDLGWKPRHDFETGLRETVQWYLAHEP